MLRNYIHLVEAEQGIAEKYTMDNKYLLHYFRDDKFDPHQCWHVACDWIEENGWLKRLAKKAKKHVADAAELHWEDPDIFFLLPEEVQKECAEYCVEYLMQHDPAEAPSTAHMMLQNNKLLPRTTWLVHFSDNAEAIAYNGFKYGIDQMDKLGLTTYWNDSAKSAEGYNFAFLANGRYASYAESKGKYGREAVIFQNSGVLVHHHGDEEEQVIFKGKDVDPRGIVYLKKRDGEWMVMSTRVKRYQEARALFKGEFEDCVKWVQANFVQYRRAMTGF